jgi:type II secretory pathway component PulC
MGYMPPPDITATTDSHNKIDIDSDSSWEDIDELNHSKQSEIHYKAVAEAHFTIDPILSIFSTEKTTEENTNRHFKRIQRSSIDQPWDICFRVDPGPKTTLQVDDQGNRATASGLLTGDIIVSMNGQKLGSDTLKNISMVVKLMKGTLDLVLEIIRGDPL